MAEFRKSYHTLKHTIFNAHNVYDKYMDKIINRSCFTCKKKSLFNFSLNIYMNKVDELYFTLCARVNLLRSLC